jgi:hypothetical protein
MEDRLRGKLRELILKKTALDVYVNLEKQRLSFGDGQAVRERAEASLSYDDGAPDFVKAVTRTLNVCTSTNSLEFALIEEFDEMCAADGVEALSLSSFRNFVSGDSRASGASAEVWGSNILQMGVTEISKSTFRGYAAIIGYLETMIQEQSTLEVKTYRLSFEDFQRRLLAAVEERRRRLSEAKSSAGMSVYAPTPADISFVFKIYGFLPPDSSQKMVHIQDIFEHMATLSGRQMTTREGKWHLFRPDDSHHQEHLRMLSAPPTKRLLMCQLSRHRGVAKTLLDFYYNRSTAFQLNDLLAIERTQNEFFDTSEDKNSWANSIVRFFDEHMRYRLILSAMTLMFEETQQTKRCITHQAVDTIKCPKNHPMEGKNNRSADEKLKSAPSEADHVCHHCRENPNDDC